MSDLLPTPDPRDRDKAAVRVIRFWTEFLPVLDLDGEPTEEVVGEDWVEWAKPGLNESSTCERIRHLQRPKRETSPTGGIMFREAWLVIRPAYDAWKRDEAAPETGTPFGAWSGILPMQADACKRANIRNVEELAAMTDAELGYLRFPHARALRDNAKAFLASKLRDAPLMDELSKRDAQIEELRATLEAVLAEQQADTADKRARQKAGAA